MCVYVYVCVCLVYVCNVRVICISRRPALRMRLLLVLFTALYPGCLNGALYPGCLWCAIQKDALPMFACLNASLSVACSLHTTDPL